MVERLLLRAVVIQNCRNLEKAIHYAYDVGKKIMGVEVEVLEHFQGRFGHIFVVGEKGLGGKLEKKIK